MVNRNADKNQPPVVLAIGGLDPSGGAGLLADTRTLLAFDCYPAGVITSITFQGVRGVCGLLHQDAETVRGQMDPVLRDLPVAALKTGMLPTREIVREIARMIREHELSNLVIDPVTVSTSGQKLIEDAAMRELKTELLPLATVITPNIPEAEALVGYSIRTEADMRRAATEIRSMGGVAAVLVKGGHLKTATEVLDILDYEGQVTVFRNERIGEGEFRGTGCALAAAIAGSLAHGRSLQNSARRGEEFVSQAIRSAYRVGGVGILFNRGVG